jgi:hypothetical protein
MPYLLYRYRIAELVRQLRAVLIIDKAHENAVAICRPNHQITVRPHGQIGQHAGTRRAGRRAGRYAAELQPVFYQDRLALRGPAGAAQERPFADFDIDDITRIEDSELEAAQTISRGYVRDLLPDDQFPLADAVAWCHGVVAEP